MTELPLAVPPPRSHRVAFLGTPPAAVPTLAAVVAAGFEVPLVVSQPDRRRGRRSRLSPSPVKAAALDLGLEVSHDPYDLIGLDVDLGVVVAYGRLLRRDLLEQVALLNVHFSILPRWRGAAPVERAILAGDATTGVCIMRITEGLDEGPVYRCVETPIAENESAASLTARLADLGAELLVDVLSAPLPEPVPQTGEATIAAKIDRSANELDFSLPAVELHRRVRIGRAWTVFRSERIGIEETRVVDADATGAAMAGSGRPGRLSTTADADGGRSVVVDAGDGTFLRLITVKPAGRRAMPAIDWWNGAHPVEGERLGR
ncbi:MAG: formyltransferase family protein [Acidimicrobiia bacterium]|nr:formyltransferase family protein [Acidimicrobiia bacterium]